MYRTLFDLAGYAIFAWLLLILLPKWRITRRIAESAVFPAYLSVLYMVGLVAVLREYGAGFMADFGTADGVLGLLAQEPIAILAWLHILAFDQVVALVIYRDNMRHRFVPLPLQSLLMVATLMLGPLGFITYWLVRLIRTRSPVAWGERHADTDVVASPAPRFAEVVASRGTGDGGGSVHGGTASGVSSRGALARPVAAVLVMISLWRRERAIVALGAAGFGFAVITTVVALLNGGWLLNAEGRLLEAVKFDVAIGIYLLTLALILPFAPMTAGDRRRWTGWTLGLGMFAYLMENVQA
ncbi:MAG: DUF4281 domain-containing protein [Chloroflexi bacterium]|nr:DUF4281 domain-containing protein [Chloroflexota bacterium]